MPPSSVPIRVLLVDDHAMVRSGLRTFLALYDDVEVVGEAGSGEEGVRRCRELRPDVVTMDLMMTGMDGAQATTTIRAECPDVQIVALTSYTDQALMERVLRAGAIGCVLKDISPEALVEAIRRAHAGLPTLAPEAAQALIHTAIKAPTAKQILTPRERQVLGLLVEGLGNPEIARRLAVSRSTVKFHVSALLKKLGVGSRTEAAAVAVREKLVEGSEDVIIESRGVPRAVHVSVEPYDELIRTRETKRREKAIARLRAVRERVSARNQDLTEEEALALADRACREAVEDMIREGRLHREEP